MFFIKDPIKFPDFVHTQKRDPQTNLKSATMMWDFWSRAPESLHQVTMLFSDRGTPDGYRHMDGFGSHTYSLINAAGEPVWVKWHFKTRQGIRNLSASDAVRLAGIDPDYAQRGLYTSIASGDFPQRNVYIQVMTGEERIAWEQRTGWDAFDLTKIWPHADFPRVPVGVLELNRNPDNYRTEVEQVAFSPASVVPGLGYSPDKMLQGRVFAYHDAQLYRVGTNHQQLPVIARAVRFITSNATAQWPSRTSAQSATTLRSFAPQADGGGFGHGDGGWAVEGTAGRYDASGRRRLHPGRQPVSRVASVREAKPGRQHRGGDVVRLAGHRATPTGPFRCRRRGLRRRRTNLAREAWCQRRGLLRWAKVIPFCKEVCDGEQ
jgi:catalase